MFIIFCIFLSLVLNNDFLNALVRLNPERSRFYRTILVQYFFLRNILVKIKQEISRF